MTRLRRQQEKLDRRNQRHRERGQPPEAMGAAAAGGSEVEDPDIAGIVPGPQPPDE